MGAEAGVHHVCGRGGQGETEVSTGAGPCGPGRGPDCIFLEDFLYCGILFI